MQPPIVTLTTDFGTGDHYVGTMKGVVLSRCPDARLIDISHDIPSFNIYAGAYAIDQAAPFFPSETVHLVVVDPGVGTERKPILVETGDQFFIAPDNGVLSLVLARDAQAPIRVIENRDLWLPHVSDTFHGRDIFAPTAGALAAGYARPKDVGPLLEKGVLLAGMEPREIGDNLWQGIVLSVDHFGNVVTNLRLSEVGAALSGHFTLSAGCGQITLSRTTFAGAPPALCFAYSGSSGCIEIGVNQGSAAQLLRVKPGDPARLQFSN